MGFRYGLEWLVSLFLEMNEDFQLGALNSRPELDNTTFLNQFINDEENDFKKSGQFLILKQCQFLDIIILLPIVEKFTEVEVLVFICGIISNSKNYKICPPSEKNYLNLYQ